MTTNKWNKLLSPEYVNGAILTVFKQQNQKLPEKDGCYINA